MRVFHLIFERMHSQSSRKYLEIGLDFFRIYFDFDASQSRKIPMVSKTKTARERSYMTQTGRNLLRIRRKAGLSQKSVADFCGVTRETYGFYERGERPFPGHLSQSIFELTGQDPRPKLVGVSGQPILIDQIVPAPRTSPIVVLVQFRRESRRNFDEFTETVSSNLRKKYGETGDSIFIATAIVTNIFHYKNPELTLTTANLNSDGWTYILCLGVMSLFLPFQVINLYKFLRWRAKRCRA